MDPPVSNRMKWLLLSVWVSRMCMLLVVIIGFSFAIALNHEDDGIPINYPVAATFLAFTVLWFLVDVIHLVLWIYNKFYLRSYMILTLVATILWGTLGIVELVRIATHKQSAEGVGVILALFLSYLATSIYTVRRNMRQRKADMRGYYSPALNPRQSMDRATSAGGTRDHYSVENDTTLGELDDIRKSKSPGTTDEEMTQRCGDSRNNDQAMV